MTSPMSRALELARLAAAAGEVPVGAVIVHEGRIIACAHNERESSQDPTRHAEMIAIQEAAKKLGSWRLIDTTLYEDALNSLIAQEPSNPYYKYMLKQFNRQNG